MLPYICAVCDEDKELNDACLMRARGGERVKYWTGALEEAWGLWISPGVI